MACPVVAVGLSQPGFGDYVYNGTTYIFSARQQVIPGSDTSKYTTKPITECWSILNGMIGKLRADISGTQNLRLKCTAQIVKTPCQATDAWANVRNNDIAECAD